MKRNFILFTSLFFFLSAFLQINAQKVRVIDNKGTLKSLNRVTVGSAPHTEPTEGDIWYDTSATSFDGDLTREHELKIYNDGSWIKLSENIYNSDGKLTYHRKIKGAGNNLTFQGINQYRLNAIKIDINSFVKPITLNPSGYNNTTHPYYDSTNYGIIANGPFWGKKAYRDSDGDTGTSGQILSSVSLGSEQGTNWIDAPTNINTTITNIVVGNKIADYTSENGTVTPINETITSISQSASNTNTQVAANTANTIATYTNENGSNTTINETVTSFTQNQPGTITSTTTDPNAGDITYINEKGATQKANIVSSDANNSIKVGSDGGAYLDLGSLVYVGSFILNNSGVTNITGIPFQPSKVVFVAHANITGNNINRLGYTNNASGTTGPWGSTGKYRLTNYVGIMNGYARNDNGTISQQVINSGSHGDDRTDRIALYSSNSNCIAMKYVNDSGGKLGLITSSLTGFTANGFTLNTSYQYGDSSEWGYRTQDINNHSILVIYTAYR